MSTIQNHSEGSHALWAFGLSGALCVFLWIALDAAWWVLAFVFMFMAGTLFKAFRKSQAESKLAYGAVEVVTTPEAEPRPPGSAKFCPECGSAAGASKFCTACGTRLAPHTQQ